MLMHCSLDASLGMKDCMLDQDNAVDMWDDHGVVVLEIMAIIAETSDDITVLTSLASNTAVVNWKH